MNRRITVRVEGKSYDITINDQADETISSAIDELEALGENIGAKRLLEAYLTKAVLAATLQTELEAIAKTIVETSAPDDKNNAL
ncbi:MAG: hypothetical protein LBC09_00565 [Helicobacteraceae bacterium]|nr:hypothetical protein [Helicobacteraceae bacterium]